MGVSEREKMALILGHNPNDSKDWPNDLIDRLIRLKREKGREALYRELEKLLRKP